MNDLKPPPAVAQHQPSGRRRATPEPGHNNHGPRVRHVRAARVIRWLTAIAATLTVLSVTSVIVRHTMVKGVPGREWLDHPVRHFDLNREGNTPTLYQGFSLLLCAATLWGIGSAQVTTQDANPTPRRPLRGRMLPDSNATFNPNAWRGLALIFALLAGDELFKWHERTIDPLRAWLGIQTGVLRYAWVVPGAAAVGVIALAYARFWFRLPRDTRRRFAVAAVLYVGGALGMELVAGVVHSRFGYNSFPYVAAAQVEEVLEMAGVIVFMHALLTHAATHVHAPLRLGRLTVRVHRNLLAAPLAERV